MRIVILYFLILAAAALPFVFRRAYGVRVLSVMVLGGIALLHFVFLMTIKRLVIDDGVRHFSVPDAGQLPPDFKVAADSVERFSEPMMWAFAALVAALIFLALFPFGILKSQSQK